MVVAIFKTASLAPTEQVASSPGQSGHGIVVILGWLHHYASNQNDADNQEEGHNRIIQKNFLLFHPLYPLNNTIFQVIWLIMR